MQLTCFLKTAASACQGFFGKQRMAATEREGGPRSTGLGGLLNQIITEAATRYEELIK